MYNGYCEKHKRPYQFFCVCGDWRYECPQCRYEGVYDTIATTQTKMNPIDEWTASDRAGREKVIKGLECLITDDVPCDGCSYNGSGYCIKNIASDALDLLKEQQKLIDEITQRRMDNGAFD